MPLSMCYMKTYKSKNGYLVKELKDHAEVTLKCGTITKLNIEDLIFLDIFPSWQDLKGYINCQRWIETEYGNVLQKIYLHRLITGYEKKWQVDHANRDKSDNRRCNLRMATASQNNANIIRRRKSNTGYRGVFCEKRSLTNKYTVTASINGKKRTSKRFATAEDAAKFYDKIALTVYGEFAVLNFEENRKLYLEEIKTHGNVK